MENDECDKLIDCLAGSLTILCELGIFKLEDIFDALNKKYKEVHSKKVKKEPFLVDKNAITATIVPEEAPIITFLGIDNQEIMRVEPNGDIYVHEKLAENDKQVVDGLRNFLLAQGF